MYLYQMQKVLAHKIRNLFLYFLKWDFSIKWCCQLHSFDLILSKKSCPMYMEIIHWKLYKTSWTYGIIVWSCSELLCAGAWWPWRTSMQSCSTSAPLAGPTCPTQRKDDHNKGDETYLEIKGVRIFFQAVGF